MQFVNISSTSASNGNCLGILNPEDTEVTNEIRAFLNKSYIEDFLNTVLDKKSKALNNYTDYFKSLFLKYTITYNKLHKLADIITSVPFHFNNSFTIDELFNYYNDQCKNTIQKELLVEMANFTGINEIQPFPGKGEFLLAFFTDLDKSNKGDLIGTKGKFKNKIIEVKSNRARIKGGNNSILKSATEVNKKLKRLTRCKFDTDNTININTLKLLFEFIKNNIDSKDLIETIMQCLINFKEQKLDKKAYKLLKTIDNFEDFKSFALTLQLFAYTNHQKIAFLILYNSIKQNFITFQVKNDFNYFYEFIKKNIINKTSWSDSKPAYEIDFK